MTTNIKHLLFWLVILTIFSSCRTVKKSTELIRTDTITTIREVTVTDTVFHIKPDSSLFEALIECDSNNNAYVKQISKLQNGNKIQTRYFFKNDTIRVESKINADSIVAYWKNYYLSKVDKSQFASTTVVKKRGGFSLKWLLIGIGAGIFIWWSKKYWIKLIKFI